MEPSAYFGGKPTRWCAHTRDAWDDETLIRQYVEGRRSRVDYLERPAFESLLPPMANKRVLDLGAGSGDWVVRMADAGTALEMSAAIHRWARAHPKVQRMPADMKTDGPFDLCRACIRVRRRSPHADAPDCLGFNGQWFAGVLGGASAQICQFHQPMGEALAHGPAGLAD